MGQADWFTPGINSHLLAVESYRLPLVVGSPTEPNKGVSNFEMRLPSSNIGGHGVNVKPGVV